MDIENAISRYKGYGTGINIIDRSIQMHKGNFINAIIGPRRAGKTFFMLQYKTALDAPDRNKIFLNGEDINLEGVTVDNLNDIEKMMFKIYNPDESKQIYLFIDEIQNFPSWGRWLRTLFDENIYRLIISGSTSELSTDNLPTELRGRALNVLVLPFSFKEYCFAKNLDYSTYMKTNAVGKLLREFEEFINFGGYPLVVEAENENAKTTILSELYDTVLQKDIIDKNKIRKTATLKAFMNSMFGSVCRIISAKKLASWLSSQGISISPQSALNYLEFAQNIFLFFLLNPYSKKPKERTTKPKLYLADSGLLALVNIDLSKKLENQVFIELLRRGKHAFYYATRSHEVDFVIEDKGAVCALIQVSYSISAQDTYSREVEALVKASDELKCRNMQILTFNEEKLIKVGSKVIKVTPTWKWMLE